VAANGDKLFSAITGKGTLTRTTAHSTETDAITGGTGLTHWAFFILILKQPGEWADHARLSA
jgi:hypothetical protein